MSIQSEPALKLAEHLFTTADHCLLAPYALDVGKRGPTIDVRLPAPEQVQVGAVENQDVLRDPPPMEMGRVSSAASSRLAMHQRRGGSRQTGNRGDVVVRFARERIPGG